MKTIDEIIETQFREEETYWIKNQLKCIIMEASEQAFKAAREMTHKDKFYLTKHETYKDYFKIIDHENDK